MRALVHILVSLSLLSFCSGAAAQQLDSARQALLGAKLDEYFEVLKHESLDVQSRECDFLIDSCADSLVREFVAMSVYSHYMTSPIMGAENVAVHVFDKWFSSGEIVMKNDIDMLNARIFADFNRLSLIGMPAPPLMMESLEGNVEELPLSSAKRYKVLYFYDVDCATCKVETILLRNVLETGDFPIDFYAVYAGDDRASWEEYVSERFDMQTERMHVQHVWDPVMESDFQRKYGVIQTPRMFLIAPDGTIIGRGLDTKALAQMLQALCMPELTYGSEESVALFDELFGSVGKAVSADGFMDIADNVAAATLERGDTLMFKQLGGDLLYYASTQRGEGMKEGLSRFIDKYIFSQDKVWTTEDDSLKVVGFAMIMDELLSKSPVGKPVPDIRLPGIILKGNRVVEGNWRLPELRGRRNVIIFHTEGCEICREEIAAAAKAVAENGKLWVLLVNMDELSANEPESVALLFDAFDLSSLPFVLETDRKGIVCKKYVSLQK